MLPVCEETPGAKLLSFNIIHVTLAVRTGASEEGNGCSLIECGEI